MSISQIFASPLFGNMTVNIFWQALLFSIAAFAVMKLLAGKSAPLRSLAASGLLCALLLIPVISAVFFVSGISFYKKNIRHSYIPAAKNEMSAPMKAESAEPASLKISGKVNESKVSAPSVKAAPSKNISISSAAPVLKKTRLGKYLPNVIGAVWICGIVFMLCRLFYGLVFLRGFRFGLTEVNDVKISNVLQVISKIFDGRKNFSVYKSSKVESPLTIGIISPIVIIPEKLYGNLSENELKSILLHELSHICHNDHIVEIFKRLVAAVNWWNPLVHIISSEHSMAREEVSDNYALSVLNPKVYSECLVGLAEKVCLISNLPGTVGMAGKHSNLEKRIRKILSLKRNLKMKTGILTKLGLFSTVISISIILAGCVYVYVDTKTPASPVKQATPVEPAKPVVSGTVSISSKDKIVEKTEKAAPKLVAPSPDMNEAIKKALKLSFSRANDNALMLNSGIEKPPVNVAFTAYGKRLRGAGDKWEAFSTFACQPDNSTLHCSVRYKFFPSLKDGDKNYFKFMFVPSKRVAEGREANGMADYYGGTVETEWMEFDMPPVSNIFELNGTTCTSIALSEAKRDDELFGKNWKEFKIKTDFGNEYWIGAGGFTDNYIETWPFRYKSSAPSAFSMRIVVLTATDEKGQSNTLYNIAPYGLYHNTSFPLYELDSLFRTPGKYQFKGEIYFFSMSGEDMAKDLLLAARVDGNYQVKYGRIEASEASALLEKLKKEYPFHSLEIAPQDISAVNKDISQFVQGTRWNKENRK